MIHFTNVSKRYQGQYEALSQINFEVKKGEFVFLTGHSGAGKSTVLKMITMVEKNTHGQIIINERNLAHVKKAEVPGMRRQMGMIFQQPRLIATRTVYENVALPLTISGLDAKEIPRRVRAALDKVSLLSKEKKLPKTLSVGEQQRVSIARAIVNKPVLLLADEPTGNLDPILAEETMTLFHQFNQVGVTIMIASHDMALIARMPHRVIVLQQGRVVKTEGEQDGQ